MDTKLLKKLRDETGASFLECKKALEASGDQYEEALRILNETVKKEETSTRIASKGLTQIVILKDEAILFEVNAETDFVAKNEHFQKLIKELGEHLIRSKVNHVKDALKFEIDGVTVEEKIQRTNSIIKENAYLRRFYRVKKTKNQGFGSYMHLGGKISTLVILCDDQKEIANALAMQVAANTPLYIHPDSIDIDTMNYERFMYEKNNGQFDDNGFKNHLNEICLMTQPYIKNPNVTVGDLLKEKELEVIDFFRFELGQGIENKLNCRLDVPCDGSDITVMPIY